MHFDSNHSSCAVDQAQHNSRPRWRQPTAFDYRKSESHALAICKLHHLNPELVHPAPIVVPHSLQLLHQAEGLGAASNVVAQPVHTSTSMVLSLSSSLFFIIRASLSWSLSIISRTLKLNLTGIAVVKLVPMTLNLADGI